MADAPVTHDELHKELTALEERLDGRLRDMENRFDGKLDSRLRDMEDRLIERMRDMQTEIIRVFMEFQQRNEARDNWQEKTASALGERVASVERRLLQIEAKLLLEPPAA